MVDFATAHRSDPFLNQRLQAVNNTTSSFYIRQEDELRLSIFTTTASLTITLNGILVGLDGDARPFAMVISPSGSGNRESVRARVGPGTVLYCIPTLTGGTPNVGDVEVVVEILQSDASTGPVVYQVLHGSVTAKGYFPYADVANTVTVTGSIAPVSSLPDIHTITVANPAAGAEWSQTVTAAQVWEIQAVRCQLTPAGGGSARQVRLAITDGSNIILRTSTSQTEISGTVYAYNAFAGAQIFTPADAANWQWPLPRIMLGAGYVLTSVTGNINAADQWSNIVICYRLYT